MYSKVESKIWKDKKFKKLDSFSQLIFLYLLTCPHRNVLGLYYLPLAYVAADTDNPLERVSKGLSELCKKGFIEFDDEADVVFIKNFLKYNPSQNENQTKGAASVLKDIPHTELILNLKDTVNSLELKGKEFLEKSIESYIQQNKIQTLSKGFGKGLETHPKQETETETETEEEEGLNYIPANPSDDCGETNSEPEKNQEEVFEKTEKPKPENKADPEITEFCNNFLLAVQKKHGIQAPKKPKLSAWEDAVDKIIRLDGFTLEQIKNAVRWGMSDSFWSPNILSLGELRKKKTGSDLTKFQKLYANYNQANTSGSGRNPPVGHTGQKPSLISLCSSYLEELENDKGAGIG